MAVAKAALIEIGGSHSECLYSQMLFLQSGGYEVTLICDEKIKPHVQDFAVDGAALFVAMGKGTRKAVLEIRRYLIDNNISTVIFNTAQSSAVRNLLLLPFPKHFRFAGTLHHINKLHGSLSQKIISRKVKKYFLLNDYLLEKIDPKRTRGLQFQSYYAIFFPEYPAAVVQKAPGSLWINIPGHIEYNRRDYETLVHTFEALPFKPDYLFLLGNGSHQHGNGAELKSLITSYGLEKYFIFWDGFIAPEEFHGYLKQSDVVMPLIHPGSEDMYKYLNEQISGNFNLAFAYKKPLLLFQAFDHFKDLKENGIFYTLETLMETLQALPQKIAATRGRMYQDEKWSFDFQAKNYLSFLEG